MTNTEVQPDPTQPQRIYPSAPVYRVGKPQPIKPQAAPVVTTLNKGAAKALYADAGLKAAEFDADVKAGLLGEIRQNGPAEEVEKVAVETAVRFRLAAKEATNE